MADLNDLTRDQLDEMAAGLGLDTTGMKNKSEVIAAIEEAQQAEEVPTVADDSGAVLCVNCGEPATSKTTNPGTSMAYYCDKHAQASGEGVERL